jgi:hypothetical protein
VYLRVVVKKNGECAFSHSVDGSRFTSTGKSFKALPGKWIGAKVGLFCAGTETTNDAGYADIDWFRFTR